jgi:twinkle protein
VTTLHTTPVPDASQYLTYDASFLSANSPDGLWLCTDLEDVAAIVINAAAIAVGAPADALRRSAAFLESFQFVLVVGADAGRRRALADQLRQQVPSVEVCVTTQSAYRGCSSVVELKDKHGLEAVETLWRDADELPPWGLLEISTIEDVDISSQPHAKSGIPALDQMIGGLYDGELSIWTGRTKAGKSTIVGLPILSAIREGRRVFVYSGELPDRRYKAWLTAIAAGPDYAESQATDTGKTVWKPRTEIARQIDLWWKDKLYIIDNKVVGVHQPETLLGLMRYASRRYGCSMFVVDNLMTLSLPGDNKYDAQSAFVGQLVDFAHVTGAHVHLVAHRRKGGAGKGGKGDSDDVSGSGDITNRADNVFAISRVEDPDSPFDAQLEVQLNRDFGETGYVNLKFDVRSRRYYQHNANWPCGWEKQDDTQVTFTELTGPDAENPFLNGGTS